MRMLLLLIALAGAPQATTAPPDPFRPINGEVVRETQHFRIYAENGYVPVDLDWFQAQLETVYADVAAKMKIQADRRFDFAFRPPDTRPCPVRGLAVTARDNLPARAVIFITDQTSREQVLGITAHEVAHLFHFGAFQAGQPNASLSEGLATWAAGKYWDAWHKRSLADFVRAAQQDGRYVPVRDLFKDEVWANSTATGDECLAQRDLRYTSVAAFIDFLIANDGMEKFKQLLGPPQVPMAPVSTDIRYRIAEPIVFVANNTRPPSQPPQVQPVRPPLNFAEVYGRTLDELEKAWLEQLAGLNGVTPQ